MSKVSSEYPMYSRHIATSPQRELNIKDYKFVSLYGDNYPYAKIQELFNDNKDLFQNEETFGDFLNNFRWSVAVLYNGKFVGCLFIDKFEKNHCYISGFADRKNAEHTAESLKLYCDYLLEKFEYDYILSETNIKPAIYCLLKAGFKGDGVYIYSAKKDLEPAEPLWGRPFPKNATWQ